MQTASFLLRRVIVGVVVGVVVLLIGFYGWMRYRTAQYHERESEMLARYQSAYTVCVTGGGAPAICALRARFSCVRDPFWAGAKPFSFDLRSVQSDATSRCTKLG